MKHYRGIVLVSIAVYYVYNEYIKAKDWKDFGEIKDTKIGKGWSEIRDKDGNKLVIHNPDGTVKHIYIPTGEGKKHWTYWRDSEGNWHKHGPDSKKEEPISKKEEDWLNEIADQLEELWDDKYGNESKKDGFPSSDGGESSGSGGGDRSNGPLEPNQPF